MKALIWLLVIVSPCINAQTFPLNKALDDEALICATKEAAIEIAESAHRPEVGVLVFSSHMRSGTCFLAKGMMTYTARVHQTKAHFYVYQMTFGKFVGFVPTNQKSDGKEV